MADSPYGGSTSERRALLTKEISALRLELDAAGDAGGDASEASWDALLALEGELAALDIREPNVATL